jgi:hypothetical protein
VYVYVNLEGFIDIKSGHQGRTVVYYYMFPEEDQRKEFMPNELGGGSYLYWMGNHFYLFLK